MTLADDETTIRFDGEVIICRPTLRAAMRLERKFEGFDNLLRAIAEQNLSAMASIIRETSPDAWELIDFFERHAEFPLNVRVNALVEPLLNLTLALAGIDSNDLAKEQSSKSGGRVSFAEHHERLFKLATGWLGWTPSETWNATPSEIMAAYQGRLDMLKAIFGGGEEKKPAMPEGAFASFLRARKAA